MTQDKKKDKIFHTEKGTYVRWLMNISPSAHEHMFVGLRTYVHEKAMQIACPGRPMSLLGTATTRRRWQ